MFVPGASKSSAKCGRKAGIAVRVNADDPNGIRAPGDSGVPLNGPAGATQEATLADALSDAIASATPDQLRAALAAMAAALAGKAGGR